MGKIKAYIKESYSELLHKVTWPSWSEVQSSAVVVLIASLLIALAVFGMDFIFQGVVNFLYNLFS
ncbi:MAG TPA: preprotein translocase subunit SecE [Bacteroidia bacterium]|nr:preprotein translocase subunit SecE [Bacteroidia bacterium]